MSKLSLPPLSGMPADVQAAFRSVAAWSAAQEKDVGVLVDAAVQTNTKTIIQKITASSASGSQSVIPTQQPTRPTLQSDFVLRSMISNSNMVAPIDLYSSVVFRAGNSATGVWIGAGGIGGSHGGIPTWAVSSQDGSFFFGKSDSGYPTDPAHKQIIFDATAGTFQFGKDIVVQTSAGPKTLDTISSASGYSTANLTADLAAGVGKVVAGIGSNYLMNVDIASGFVAIAHKDAVFKGTAAAGSVKPAIGITSTGIAMGYNRASDGVWIDSVAIDSSGNASFSGAINATSGNFTGTITAGSVITDTVTVGGTALSAIKAGAASGATAVQPAGLAGYATTGSIANLIDKTAATTLSGTITPASGVANSGAFKLGTLTWNASGVVTGGSGIAITAAGIVGATGGATTFSIDASGNAVFKGNITGATGTFSGNISTAGFVSASGSTSVDGNLGVIAGRNSSFFGSGIIGTSYIGATNGSHGVMGISFVSGGNGVVGLCAGSANRGVYGQGGQYGVYGMGTVGVYSEGSFGTNNSGMVANLNAEFSNKLYNTGHSYTFSGGTTSGGSTGSYIGTNKPGVNSNNGWLQIYIDGSPYYIPIWS